MPSGLPSLFALAGALTSLAAAQAPLKLFKVEHDTAQAAGAYCLDGSVPAFWLGSGDPNRWVIFIEGGGWCFGSTANATIQSCAGRAGGGGGSSNGLPLTFDAGGMMSTDPVKNPRFANYSKVFVHYCDGTSHSSDAAEPILVGANTTIYLRGRRNLKTIIQVLQEYGLPLNPAEVLISGGSAGATSTYLAIDWLYSYFSTTSGGTTKVLAVPDAGFFLNGVNYHSNSTDYLNDFKAADGVWNSSVAGNLNAGCLAAYSLTRWLCYLPQYSAPFITTPLFISNSLLDMWQVLNDLALPCVPTTDGSPVSGYPSCTPAELAVMNAYRDEVLAALQAVLATSPGTGTWAVTCFVHEINVEYCSTQSLPNCCGWSSATYPGPSCATGGSGNYTIPWTRPGSAPSQRWNLNDAFTLWYDSLVADDAVYAAVVRARQAYIRRAVPYVQAVQQRAAVGAARAAPPLPPTWAQLQAEDDSGEMEALAAQLPPPVQVLDTVQYPGNPSCPFPGK